MKQSNTMNIIAGASYAIMVLLLLYITYQIYTTRNSIKQVETFLTIPNHGVKFYNNTSVFVDSTINMFTYPNMNSSLTAMNGYKSDGSSVTDISLFVNPSAAPSISTTDAVYYNTIPNLHDSIKSVSISGGYMCILYENENKGGKAIALYCPPVTGYTLNIQRLAAIINLNSYGFANMADSAVIVKNGTKVQYKGSIGYYANSKIYLVNNQPAPDAAFVLDNTNAPNIALFNNQTQDLTTLFSDIFVRNQNVIVKAEKLSVGSNGVLGIDYSVNAYYLLRYRTENGVTVAYKSQMTDTQRAITIHVYWNTGAVNVPTVMMDDAVLQNIPNDTPAQSMPSLMVTQTSSTYYVTDVVKVLKITYGMDGVNAFFASKNLPVPSATTVPETFFDALPSDYRGEYTGGAPQVQQVQSQTSQPTQPTTPPPQQIDLNNCYLEFASPSLSNLAKSLNCTAPLNGKETTGFTLQTDWNNKIIMYPGITRTSSSNVDCSSARFTSNCAPILKGVRLDNIGNKEYGKEYNDIFATSPVTNAPVNVREGDVFTYEWAPMRYYVWYNRLPYMLNKIVTDPTTGVQSLEELEKAKSDDGRFQWKIQERMEEFRRITGVQATGASYISNPFKPYENNFIYDKPFQYKNKNGLTPFTVNQLQTMFGYNTITRINPAYNPMNMKSTTFTYNIFQDKWEPLFHGAIFALSDAPKQLYLATLQKDGSTMVYKFPPIPGRAIRSIYDDARSKIQDYTLGINNIAGSMNVYVYPPDNTYTLRGLDKTKFKLNGQTFNFTNLPTLTAPPASTTDSFVDYVATNPSPGYKYIPTDSLTQAAAPANTWASSLMPPIKL